MLTIIGIVVSLLCNVICFIYIYNQNVALEIVEKYLDDIAHKIRHIETRNITILSEITSQVDRLKMVNNETLKKVTSIIEKLD